MDNSADLIACMEQVAISIWGSPSDRSKTELRFGRKGSVSVDLRKGTWFDHEAGEGGGVLDALKKRMQGIHNDHEAIEWLEEQRLLNGGSRRRNGAHEQRQANYTAPKDLGELTATYYYTDGGTTTLPSGSEGTYTIASPNDLILAKVLNYTTQNMTLQTTFLLSSVVGQFTPDAFSLIVVNNSGAAVAASGVVVGYRPIFETNG